MPLRILQYLDCSFMSLIEWLESKNAGFVRDRTADLYAKRNKAMAAWRIELDLLERDDQWRGIARRYKVYWDEGEHTSDIEVFASLDEANKCYINERKEEQKYLEKYFGSSPTLHVMSS